MSPTLPSFTDLVANDPAPPQSLCYWLGTLDSEVSLDILDADELTDLMAAQYDVEDQHFASEYPLLHPVIGLHFIPVAPVTVCREWSPLRSAGKWLGFPDWFQYATSRQAPQAVAACWSHPNPESIESSFAESEDESHFRFLLGLASMRSEELQKRVMLISCPGWSFEEARRTPMGSLGYSALTAGRLYPERLPSGALWTERM
ncbi:MAG: hypothetical protein EOP88_19415 [Verrucomicrobiaceae bacterium]|nr:MAG: hypothetical protein EOP88_19415 [Verrucomicrobiaceae bacterium]